MFSDLLNTEQQWSQRSELENSKINIEFLRKNKVGLNQINLHVKPWMFSMAPKTAGEWLDKYLIQIFSLKNILAIDSRQLNALPQALFLQNKCADAIRGEYCISDLIYQLLPNKRLVHLGMMREPLMRIVYLYNDRSTQQMYVNKKPTSLIDFETYIYDVNPLEINNGQAKRLAGVLNSSEKISDQELYLKAKFTIDHCYSLMGIAEQFEDFYRILGRKCGVKFQSMPPILRTKLKVRLTDIKTSSLTYIKNKNKVDIQLYHYVESQFKKYLSLMN